jgi:trimethylamine-N-oxide reductase (cytochrome c)
MNVSYRKGVYHPARVLYPLKRVDWEPGGDPSKTNIQNRGKSKFKRISWDEAAAIVATEINRIAQTYGPEAIGNTDLQQGNAAEFLLNPYLWSKYGRSSTQTTWSTDTNVGRSVGARFFWGMETRGSDTGFFRKIIADNTEMIVGWAANYTGKNFSQVYGLIPARVFNLYRDLGIKNVCINTNVNRGSGVFQDKWIPILPCTDCALALAIAYIWLKEETYDKSYLDTHSIGFDKWEAYVTGDEDGVPKTPEWASPLCGVPTWTIKALARVWASKTTRIHHGCAGGGVSRAPYTSEISRMLSYLPAMQGWGRPGVNVITKDTVTEPLPAEGGPSVAKASRTAPVIAWCKEETGRVFTNLDEDRQLLTRNLVSHAIIFKEISWYGGNETVYPVSDCFIKRQYPLPGKPRMRMCWMRGANALTSRVDGSHLLQALHDPDIEFVVGNCIMFADIASYYDLILPITTSNENDEISTARDSYTTLISGEVGIKPLGESKTDHQANIEIAKKLGFEAEYTQGQTEDGLNKSGYDNSGWQDLVSWEDLKKNKYFSLPPNPKWVDTVPAGTKFYNDPDKNPLQTPSGKLEFYSQQIEDNWPGDKERGPIAKYVRGGAEEEDWTHDEDRLISKRAEKYPLLMESCCRDFANQGSSDMLNSRG